MADIKGEEGVGWGSERLDDKTEMKEKRALVGAPITCIGGQRKGERRVSVVEPTALMRWQRYMERRALVEVPRAWMRGQI